MKQIITVLIKLTRQTIDPSNNSKEYNMGYLRKRSTQVSTWAGLTSAMVALANSGGDWKNPMVISSLLSALGLIHIDESKSD